jgi:hypothetical protein
MFTTSATTNIIIFGPPPCPHPSIDIDCDVERQELRVTCEQCRKAIVLPRVQVAGDATGDATRGMVAAAFGRGFLRARFPWERLYRCHAVGLPVETAAVWSSRIETLLRRFVGRLVAWLWRYDPEVFANL